MPQRAFGRWRRAATAVAAVTVLAGTAACSAPGAVSAEIAAVYAQVPGISAQRAEAEQRRDVTVLEWASELGVSDHTDTPALPGAAARAEYGARGADDWGRHQNRMERLAQRIRDEIRAGLSIDEVHAYYRRNPERFAQQDALRVSVTEWDGGRVVARSTLEIDASNVRALQEHDDRVVAVALTLAEGDERSVDRGHGRYAQLRCESRTDGGVTPFDEVVQAAAGQLAAETFEAELSQRLSIR